MRNSRLAVCSANGQMDKFIEFTFNLQNSFLKLKDANYHEL